MIKIICVGNRYIYPDGAALTIYDQQQQFHLDFKVERNKVQWVEGGLGGLSLLPHFETDANILILDYMPQYPNASLVPFDQLSVTTQDYHHATAFLYLLQTLKYTLEKIPDIMFVSCRPEQTDWELAVKKTLQQLIK